MDAFKKQAAKKRPSCVVVEYTKKDRALLEILERIKECKQESELKQQKELQVRKTVEELRKWAVEKFGETRKKMSSEKEDGVMPNEKQKEVGR